MENFQFGITAAISSSIQPEDDGSKAVGGTTSCAARHNASLRVSAGACSAYSSGWGNEHRPACFLHKDIWLAGLRHKIEVLCMTGIALGLFGYADRGRKC